MITHLNPILFELNDLYKNTNQNHSSKLAIQLTIGLRITIYRSIEIASKTKIETRCMTC